MAAGGTSSTNSSSTQSAGGKAANGLSSNGMNSTNPNLAGGGSSSSGGGGNGGGGGGGGGGMMGMDDGDNRTRNAKAQRRHREKRKAHLKALEESVQVLTAQLEDARRQLGQAAYFSSSGQRNPNAPLSPQSKDVSQFQAENAYLRDENADLRRQLYSYRSTYGHPAPPPPDAPKEGGHNGSWGEVKSEQGGGGIAYPHQPPPQGNVSPRRQRPSGEASQVGGGGEGNNNNSTSQPGGGGGAGNNESSNSASSSSNSYPPMDHFTPMHQRSRSRVMSSSSAPSASPYMQSDPRIMDGRYPGPMRYDSQPGMYNAPPTHQVPRYEVPQQHGHHHPYASRQEGHEQVSWPPESGPPPFASYPMGFGNEGGSGEEWRPEHS